MKHLAIYEVETGRVIGTISAEIVPEPEPGFAYTEYDTATDPRGWLVAGETLVPSITATPAITLYTFNQWVDLFPLGEQVAIVTATMSDPMAKLIYDRAQSASGSIDPRDPRTLEGVGYLVEKGYVSKATADRIAGL